MGRKNFLCLSKVLEGVLEPSYLCVKGGFSNPVTMESKMRVQPSDMIATSSALASWRVKGWLNLGLYSMSSIVYVSRVESCGKRWWSQKPLNSTLVYIWYTSFLSSKGYMLKIQSRQVRKGLRRFLAKHSSALPKMRCQ